jgi:hypothetical protein
MIEILTGLGYGIIGLAVVIGIGIVIIVKLGANVANCPTAFPTYNATNGLCQNSTYYTVNPSTATSTLNTVSGYLGTGTGGLATWIPIIIVLVIGMAFLGAFMVNKSRKA